MTDDFYDRVVIARRAPNLKALGMLESVLEADIVVGKDRTVLKDRFGVDGRKLTERQVSVLVDEAGSVVTL